MKSFGRTGFAAAAVLAIVAYAYFVEYKGAEKEKTHLEESEKLVKVDKDAVTKLEILRAGKTVRLEKTGAQWKVTDGDGIDAHFAGHWGQAASHDSHCDLER